jgi:hypothetical protein
MTDRWIRVNRTIRADGTVLVPKEKMGSELHSDIFLAEDASFDQLYSLQRIELTEKLRKNHGRDESWRLLIRLKMAGLVRQKRVLPVACMQSSCRQV